MKDSGVEWIGEIPVTWEALPIKRVISTADYGISESLDAQGAIPVLRMGNIVDGTIDFSDLRFVDSVDEYLVLRKDDLLYNRTNSMEMIGKVGLFQTPEAYEKVSFASYLVRLRV